MKIWISFRLAALLCAACWLPSCGSSPSTSASPPQTVPTATGAPLTQPPIMEREPVEPWIVDLPGGVAAAADNPEVVRPRDVLNIVVYNQPELSAMAKVPGSGRVTLPLLGPIDVVGHSPVALARQIAKKLQERTQVEAPDVTVSIAEYAPRRVYIYGAVRTPRLVEVPRYERLRLSQALAISGGFTTVAEQARVRVVRELDDGRLRVQVVDATAFGREEQLENDIYLADGDTVIVEQAERIFVMGKVQRPGAYSVDKPEERTFAKIIGHAGGFSDAANLTRVRCLLRRPDGGYVEHEVNVSAMIQEGKMEMDFPVPSGSIIYVPLSWW